MRERENYVNHDNNAYNLIVFIIIVVHFLNYVVSVVYIPNLSI